MQVHQLLESTDTVTNDLLRLLVGQRLGSGMSRNVYALRNNETMVVKIENEAHMFQNILEHQVWDSLCFSDLSRWLAPVREISPCGTCLLMDRTAPVGHHDLPKFIPVWLTDTKAENWGWLGGRVVCHDYGIHLGLAHGVGKKVRIANWY